MLLGKEDNLVGHAPSHVWEVAETHINAYQYDDIDRLMGTVSPRGGIWSGLLPGQGAVIMRTTDQIREAYTEALAATEIGPCQSYVAVASDWYVLVEGLTTVTEKATGRSLEMTGLGLYGTDGAGLAMDTDVGSIIDPERAAQPVSGRQKLADFGAHRRRREAFAAGDLDEALAGVGDRIDLFLPCFDAEDDRPQLYVGDRPSYRAYLEDFAGRYRVDSARQVSHLTTAAWVFSVVEWSLTELRAGVGSTVRFALCEVLAADGTVRGGIGVAVRV